MGLSPRPASYNVMQFLRKKITSRTFDIVFMLFAGWCLIDLAAVAHAIHPLFAKVLIAVGILCFLVAWRSWRHKPPANT